MAIEIPNLQETIDALTDEQVLPVVPTPNVQPPYVPGAVGIRKAIELFKQKVEEGKSRGNIFEEVTEEAFTLYGKVIIADVLVAIWDAWQAEIAERRAASGG